MIATYKNLLDAGIIGQVPTAVGAVATCPASKKWLITNIFMFNTDSVSREVTLYKVPNDAGSVGTAVAGHMIFKYRFEPEEGYELPFNVPGTILENENDTIQAVVSDESTAPVTIQITGRQDG